MTQVTFLAASEAHGRRPALASSLASDTMTVSDAASGLTFTVSVYPGYHKSMIEVSVAWGVKAWKPDFIATLLG